MTNLYDEVPSLARGQAKGFPRRIREWHEDTEKRITFPNLCKKRNANYRRVCTFMKQRYSGLIVGIGTYDKGTKQESTVFTHIDANNLSEVCFTSVTVTLKDPTLVMHGGLNVIISRHALERLFHRLPHRPDLDRDGEIIDELTNMLGFITEPHHETGAFEIGSGEGLFTVKVSDLDEEKKTLTATTWVSAEQLRNTQSATVGSSRKTSG